MTSTEQDIRVGAGLGLRVGDTVEVRSEAEILATLDENGELDCLPFMPEMLRFCGHRMKVYKVAHKTCDTMERTGMRRMRDTVHLEGIRCDGSAHGGCQASCLVFWKEAWLKRAGAPDDTSSPWSADPARCTLPVLELKTRKEPAADGSERFSCQATELLRAAPERLPFRAPGQYVRDIRSGNARPREVLRWLVIGFFNRWQDRSAQFLPPRLRFRGGLPWGFLVGHAGRKTPLERTDLQPGERVRIRTKEEILETLDENLRNRGMGFEIETAVYCGKEARVARRVEQLIDERTGAMLRMKNPCVVLDGVFCTGVYNAHCPRAVTTLWRENWVERLDQSSFEDRSSSSERGEEG